MNTARPHAQVSGTELAQSLHVKRPVADLAWTDQLAEEAWNLGGSNLVYDSGLEPEITLFGRNELIKMHDYAPIIGKLSMGSLSNTVRQNMPPSFKNKAIFTPSELSIRTFRDGPKKQRVMVLELTNTTKFDDERTKAISALNTCIGRRLTWEALCPAVKLLPLAHGANLPETFLQDLRAFLPKTITAAPGYVEPVEVAKIG